MCFRCFLPKSPPPKPAASLPLSAMLFCIRFYQRRLSPLMTARCRFYPTCSAYVYYALSWHGVRRGFLLGVWRLLRCHPWGGSGVDWPPLPLYRFLYTPAARPFCPLFVGVSYKDALLRQTAKR